MKREDIKTAFDRIEPDLAAKERMLENILNHSKNRKEDTMLSFNFRKAIPTLALAVVFAVGIFTYSFKDRLFNHGLRGNGNPEIAQRDIIGEDAASGREDMAAPMLNQFQIGDRHYILTSDYVEEFGFPAVISDKDIGPKIATIEKSPDKSLVGCEVYRYIPAGCEAVVAVKKNNEYVLFKFFTFESYNNNQDEDAIEYLKLYGIEKPEDIAKIQFIVHTEKSKLEGINNVKSEITDRNEIAKFYSFYSVLKNSSDKYFEKLFGNIGSEYSRDVEIDMANPNGQDNSNSSDVRSVEPVPPDYVPAPDDGGAAGKTGNASSAQKEIAEDLPMRTEAEGNDASITSVSPAMSAQPADMEIYESDTPVSAGMDPGDGNVSKGASQGMKDMGGETGAGSVAPAQGSAGDALAYPVAIRIYNQNGVYFESMYYRNIGFLSRYEISAEFAAFINSYIQ